MDDANDDMCRLIERIARMASPEYAFLIKHVATNDEPTRDVKMGSETVVFPFEFHELACGFPNAAFISAGAAWSEVSKSPTLTLNRSQSTYVGDVEIPAHRASVFQDGIVYFWFQNVALRRDTAEGDCLRSSSAFAFANKFVQRFEWLAIEKTAAPVQFVAMRNAPVAPSSLRSKPIKIVAANLPPHSFTLTDLEFDLLNSSEFVDSLGLMTSDALGHDVATFGMGNIVEQGLGVGGWENAEVIRKLKERLAKWTRTGRDTDDSKFRHRRDAKPLGLEDLRAEVLQQRSRDGAAALPRRTSNAAIATGDNEGDNDDDNDDDGVAPSRTSNATDHVFFVPTGRRYESQLIRCRIAVYDSRHVAPATISNTRQPLTKTLLHLVQHARRDTPYTQMPLFRRLCALAETSATKAMLRRWETNPAQETKESLKSRYTPLLVETVALVAALWSQKYWSHDLPFTLIASPLVNKTEVKNAWTTKLEQTKDVLKEYGQFQTMLETLSELYPDNPRWVKYGDSKPSNRVQITLTTHHYGERFNDTVAPTPLRLDSFRPALVASIARLCFDPRIAEPST